MQNGVVKNRDGWISSGRQMDVMYLKTRRLKKYLKTEESILKPSLSVGESK